MSLSPLRSTLFPYTTLFRSGDMDVVIAGGVESMTRSPMFSNVGETEPSERLTKKYDIVNQGIAAEKIAEKWGFTREKLDEFSLKSHEKALQAIENRHLDDEIIPITVNDESIATAEAHRNSTTLQ